MQVIDSVEKNATVELRGTVKFSYDDFQKIPYDGLGHHLISGVHIITPAPSILHQKIVGRIFRLLSDYVDEKQLGEILISPIDVKFSEKDGFQPDLLYIQKKHLAIIGKNFVDGSPDLIIEVISPGSKNIDRGWKKNTAEQYRVKEYWLINPQKEEVEIFTHSGRKFEQSGHYKKEDVIKSRLEKFGDLNFPVQKLFIG